MANIGTFKKSGDTNYTGEIVTPQRASAKAKWELAEEERAPGRRGSK